MSHEASAKSATLEHLQDAIDSGSLAPVRRMLKTLHPAEIGNMLESLPPAERNIVWDLVDAEDGGETLVHVNDEVRQRLIEGMADEELIAATDGMEVDDLADLLADLPEAITQRILLSMDQQNRQRLESVLRYDEDSAGGLMNTDTITVRPAVTVDVVLRYLRQHKNIPDQTDTIFVVNRYGEYLGMLYVTRLLTHPETSSVEELMDKSVEGINADMPANEVAQRFEDRDLVSAPVVDDRGLLLGRITIDDVVDVIRDEAEHSLMSMAGLDEEADMFAPVMISARRRAVWLCFNLATAFVAAWVVGFFEATIEQVVALAVLMPVVASMGGVAGMQTLTLVIRGLALGQLQGSNTRWLAFKEIAVGSLNGIGFAILIAVVTGLWFDDWRISAVIAGAMVINMMAAALAGVAVPLLLRRLDIDPALAGSVVLTTITDVIGFATFLGLGTVFLAT
ncbi:MAG: magnesium transporter [Gammaproteobacteria bacterium]